MGSPWWTHGPRAVTEEIFDGNGGGEATSVSAVGDATITATEDVIVTSGTNSNIDLTVTGSGRIFAAAPSGLVILGDAHSAGNDTIVEIQDNIGVINLVVPTTGTLTIKTGSTNRLEIAQGANPPILFTGLTTFNNRVEAENFQTFDMPTADPHVAGRFWNSAGTVKISAG